MTTSPSVDLHPTVCPYTIARPTMRMSWEELTFIHWRYPADEIQRLLPRSLTVETMDGSAWVGLIPFQMRVDVPFLPRLPRILHFPETNVRTYVVDRQGRVGVWFFSLEASSPLAVATARATYRVPYFWADMSLHRFPGGSGSHRTEPTAPLATEGDRLRYRSRRRLPGPRGASSLVETVVGPPLADGEATPLDRFLTARWALYGTYASTVIRAPMHHPPWPLHHASLEVCHDELVTAAGLTAPRGRPLVLYAPQVDVRCGWPSRA